MTDVNEIIRQVHMQLDQAGIDSPQAEAATIVAHVLNISRGKLGVLQALGDELDDDAVAKIAELAGARATRIPLQYLTGTTGFYGLDLQVSPGVFIPRVETEILVESTLERLGAPSGPVNILDLCTGSGAIAAALGDQLHKRKTTAHIWAVDVSAKAVELARMNTANYNVTVLCADATDHRSVIAADPALAALPGGFEVVVSNPPYIPTTTPVTQHEADQDPDLALYGGSPDGTAVPLRIAEQAAFWLAPGGVFMMEHDHTHAERLVTALTALPAWQEVHTIQDLTGTDRFLAAIRTPSAKPNPKSTSTLAQ